MLTGATPEARLAQANKFRPGGQSGDVDAEESP